MAQTKAGFRPSCSKKLVIFKGLFALSTKGKDPPIPPRRVQDLLRPLKNWPTPKPPILAPFHTATTKNYVGRHYYVIRNQEEWNRYVNFPEKEIARVNFDKQMLVVFPFCSPPGQRHVHIKVSSACVLPDHIQINYSIVGYRHLKPNRNGHLRSIAVVLPNLNLPVVALQSDASEN